MTPEQYQNEASRTESIVTSIEGYKPTRLIHGMLGLISESGEIADTLKRWLYYRQPLDEDNLKEEIGDLLWYVALICNTLGIQMSDCMESNIRKLQKRFPEKFDQELAKEENRDRQSEMEAVTQKQTAECKFKVGQVWENASGESFQITSVTSDKVFRNTHQPIEAVINGVYFNFTVEGYYGDKEDRFIEDNLIRLISDPVEENQDRESEMEAVAHPLKENVWEQPIHLTDETRNLCLNWASKKAGFEEGLQVAKDIADMLDGQDRKQALKMIEERRVEFLGKDQD